MSQNQNQAVLRLEYQHHRFSFLSPRQWKRKRKKKRIHVRENINLPKGVEEKKTVLSIRVMNLVFKSHVSFAIGKIVRPTGLLRSSNEETIGIDGNGAEESWRPVNSMFSHLQSPSCSVVWSAPKVIPSVCFGLGQPHCHPWKPCTQLAFQHLFSWLTIFRAFIICMF